MQFIRPAITSTVIDPPSRPMKGMIWIAGGTFLMGSERHYPEESPVHPMTVEGFWISKSPVTNSQFALFVDETSYVTVAERTARSEGYAGIQRAWLQPASVVFRRPLHRGDLGDICNWWGYVSGANWKHPEGPHSSIEQRADHPVVHLAYEDCEAFAKWMGQQIPTEAEWEFAARGGLERATYAWGEEFTPNGRYMANTWQGEFPWQNTKADGYEGTSPVGVFPPNGYGLYDMIGNVWEWTSDWYSAHHLPARTCCGAVRPSGGDREQSYDPAMPNVRIPRKVIKGGSYLCAPNYCRRYRPAARMAQHVDTSTCHVGLRLVFRIEKGFEHRPAGRRRSAMFSNTGLEDQLACE